MENPITIRYIAKNFCYIKIKKGREYYPELKNEKNTNDFCEILESIQENGRYNHNINYEVDSEDKRVVISFPNINGKQKKFTLRFGSPVESLNFYYDLKRSIVRYGLTQQF